MTRDWLQWLQEMLRGPLGEDKLKQLVEFQLGGQNLEIVSLDQILYEGMKLPSLEMLELGAPQSLKKVNRINEINFSLTWHWLEWWTGYTGSKEFISPTFFFMAASVHMEFPRPGTESKSQLQPIPQLQQCWILNPLYYPGWNPYLSFDLRHCSSILNTLCHTRNSYPTNVSWAPLGGQVLPSMSEIKQ